MDLTSSCKQSEFGLMIGVSQQAVSDMVGRRVLTPDGSCGQWLIEYCGHLREQAAGRQTDGVMNLATERARLSRAQAEIAEMTLAEKRGSLVPIALIEPKLKAAAIAARVFLEQQPAPLALRLEGLNCQARETLLAETFDAFLKRIAELAGGADTDFEDEGEGE